MSQFDLNEVLTCGEQLLTVLVGDNTEAVTLQKVQEMSQEVAALRQKQLKQLKEDIQYLTSGLNDNVGSSRDSRAETEDLTDTEASLKNRVATAQSQSAAVVKDCQQVKEELIKAQQEQQLLKEQRQSHKNARAAALPKARCDVNLYSNITSLRWQHNCEPHEVKGFISNKNDVKTFNLNSQEVSRFFITNYLWDLIEEDW